MRRRKGSEDGEVCLKTLRKVKRRINLFLHTPVAVERVIGMEMMANPLRKRTKETIDWQGRRQKSRTLC